MGFIAGLLANVRKKIYGRISWERYDVVVQIKQASANLLKVFEKFDFGSRVI